MKIATSIEMREFDQRAETEFGLPSIVLMENAGAEISRSIVNILGSVQNRKICLLAGKGNNGGDGFVAARHLANQGAKVKVFIIKDGDLSKDSATNLDVILLMGLDVLEVSTDRDWDRLSIALTFADCLIDGLLGTGFHGTVSGKIAKAIDLINRFEKSVVAIDIPSGVEANTGQVGTTAVQATHTVTLALPKPGLFLYPGASYANEVILADIGLPSQKVMSQSLKQSLIKPALVRQLIPKRPRNAHKGTCGRALILAGSEGMTGAAALCCEGALRGGAGLVTLGIAQSLNATMEVKLTEVMTKPLPETAEHCLSREAESKILELLPSIQVLAMGPGLGRAAETEDLILSVVEKATCPLVLDADALNALAGKGEVLKKAQHRSVITPHYGEMARLTGLSIEEIQKNALQTCREYAVKWNTVLVLKGACTLVAFPDENVYINTTGNAGMATGGMGDVLTGLITALVAQGSSVEEAALCAVYLHGLAGDITSVGGMVGLTAGDVARAIPAAILGILDSSKVNS